MLFSSLLWAVLLGTFMRTLWRNPIVLSIVPEAGNVALLWPKLGQTRTMDASHLCKHHLVNLKKKNGIKSFDLASSTCGGQKSGQVDSSPVCRTIVLPTCVLLGLQNTFLRLFLLICTEAPWESWAWFELQVPFYQQRTFSPHGRSPIMIWTNPGSLCKQGTAVVMFQFHLCVSLAYF